MIDSPEDTKSGGQTSKIVEDLVKLARSPHKAMIPADKVSGKITWEQGFVDVPGKDAASATQQKWVVRLNVPKGEMIVKGGRQVDTKIVMDELARRINESGVLKVVRTGLRDQPHTNVFADGKNNWSIVIRGRGEDKTVMTSLTQGLEGALGPASTSNWTHATANRVSSSSRTGARGTSMERGMDERSAGREDAPPSKGRAFAERVGSSARRDVAETQEVKDANEEQVSPGGKGKRKLEWRAERKPIEREPPKPRARAKDADPWITYDRDTRSPRDGR